MIHLVSIFIFLHPRFNPRISDDQNLILARPLSDDQSMNQDYNWSNRLFSSNHQYVIQSEVQTKVTNSNEPIGNQELVKSLISLPNRF